MITTKQLNITQNYVVPSYLLIKCLLVHLLLLFFYHLIVFVCNREYKFTKKKKENQQQSDLLPTTPTKRKGSFGRPSLLDSCFRCFKEAFTLWPELTTFIPYHLAFCELTVANSDYYQTVEPPTRSYGTLLHVDS